MKISVIVSVAALFFSLLSACFSEPVNLDGLKAGFERKTGEVLKPLVGRHTGFLLNLERILARSESLEDALLVREERVRVDLAEGVDSLIKTPNAPPQLVVLSVRFRREVISAMRTWENKYDKALVDLLRQLQRAVTLEDALLVKAELEGFRKKIEARKSQIQGVAQGGVRSNVALASAGATAKAPKGAVYLNDGVVTGYKDGKTKGFAWGSVPCNLTVEFRKAQRIGQIRFLLWDAEAKRTYRYRLFVQRQASDDWDLIADHSEKPSKSWQEHSFNNRAVSAVRIEGLGNSSNTQFHVVEIEAR
jgi:hypothetical protein